MADKTKNEIKSVKTAVEILNILKENDGLRLTQLANKLDLPKSTTHRYLNTLTESELLIRNKNTYHISGRFIDFAGAVYRRDDSYSMIQKKVDQLANETAELVQFLIEEHHRAVYVFQKAGGNGIQLDTEEGAVEHLHSTAGGKAILSTWSDTKIEEFCTHRGLPQITPETITGKKELHKEIVKVRQQGYAVNDQENINGVRAVAVPINNASGSAIGALCISGPINRIKGQVFTQEIPDLLLGVSNELELNFRFQGQ